MSVPVPKDHVKFVAGKEIFPATIIAPPAAVKANGKARPDTVKLAHRPELQIGVQLPVVMAWLLPSKNTLSEVVGAEAPTVAANMV